MPTYEYVCGKCGSRFERRQSISDAPLVDCDSCHGPLKRVISGGAGFIMKSGAQHHSSRTGCSLETHGRTCCGRSERCGKPSCDDPA